MSAGKACCNSEFNHARDDVTHFLQIWIEPNVSGIRRATSRSISTRSPSAGGCRLVASPDGRDGSVTIHQDAHLYAALLDVRTVRSRSCNRAGAPT